MAVPVPSLPMNGAQLKLTLDELRKSTMLRFPNISALLLSSDLSIGDLATTPEGTFSIVAPNTYVPNGNTVQNLETAHGQAVLNPGEAVSDFDALSSDTRSYDLFEQGQLIFQKLTGNRWQVLPRDSESYHFETIGGVKLRDLSETYDPVAYGWKNGDDIAKYLNSFFSGDKTTFYLPPGSNYVLASEVRVDLSTVITTEKILQLTGTRGTRTVSAGLVRIQTSEKRADTPIFTCYGGETVFNTDGTAWVIEDTNQVRFIGHVGWGSLDNSRNQGTLFLIRNKNGYCERTQLIDCKARYLKHFARFDLKGGIFGGLSFKGTRISNLEVSGGVSGLAQISITTDAEVSLAVSSASDYRVGETVVQAVSGAYGTVLGYPEGNDIIFVSNVVGAFNTTNIVTGEESGASKIPNNVCTPRYPNLYDSSFNDIKGNLNGGVIVMDLGGSMRDTNICNLSCEASVGTTAHYFKDLGSWSTGRPRITLPDLGGQMTYFSAVRTSKVSRAQTFLDGICLPPSEVSPDTTDGVIAVADGISWNPGNIGVGNGGKGIFTRLFGTWRRVNVLTLTSLAKLGDITDGVNTSEKFLGKEVTISTNGHKYVALGAAARDAWHPISENNSASNISPT
ncbi:hypothetical protein [Puniceibacterium antarcticum]|uniref:hypothetical protein n=1 Tax=Puniceibacterium antarcticum TaxID=1206336 RepID=UPI00117AA03F|nr:hypothetical protein [Puniceibacterium antarcticum]